MFPDILGFERALPYLAGAFLASYLIGSAPFGLLVARAFGLGDVRKSGSGNIGATNLLRTGGVWAGLATLSLDAAKGFLPAYLIYLEYGPMASAFAGFGAFLGHCFSIYLGFWGGKGVATGFGVLLAWRWEIALICALIWVGAAAASRIVSVASLAAALGAVLLFRFMRNGPTRGSRSRWRQSSPCAMRAICAD